MSHFAPVAPIQVLEAMYEESPRTFGEYHLLLAHHTVAEEQRFRELFRRVAVDAEIGPLVIMDNSVVETGGYVDFDLMVRATSIVADYGITTIPVLPDVMGDGQATRRAVEEAYFAWSLEMPGDGFMAVCQGKDWEDYTESVAAFVNPDYDKIVMLGIPRVLVGTLGTRHDAILHAGVHVREGQKLHMLGYSDDMRDDLQYSRLPMVHGIDSAVPLRYNGFFTFGVDPGKRPEDWFETAEFTRLMHTNLEFARGAHRG